MSETPPNLIEGFSPENVRRIYQGKPALINGREPADVLTDHEFEVVSRVADGLTYEQIAEDIRRSPSTVNSHANTAWNKLGLLARSQLAGYFPLDPGDETLTGRKLGDLPGRASIEILQALSIGQYDKLIARQRRISVSTVKTHVYNAGLAWDAKGELRLTMIVDGIRAGHVNVIETGMVSVETDQIGELTLSNLVKVEPALLQQAFVDCQEYGADLGVAIKRE